MFKKVDYQTAATAAIQAMRDAEAKGGDYRNDPTYKQAMEKLSLMNTVRDMELSNDSMVYATANGFMYSWKVMDYPEFAFNDIKSVNPDVVLLHSRDGKWGDMTHYFK